MPETRKSNCYRLYFVGHGSNRPKGLKVSCATLANLPPLFGTSTSGYSKPASCPTQPGPSPGPGPWRFAAWTARAVASESSEPAHGSDQPGMQFDGALEESLPRVRARAAKQAFRNRKGLMEGIQGADFAKLVRFQQFPVDKSGGPNLQQQRRPHLSPQGHPAREPGAPSACAHATCGSRSQCRGQWRRFS